ncbi:Xaa-Pro peptidase family protein [Gemmata sp. JC717]|uniref:Xaa-Pro peptidase family protein n=1 Tax=Gemmata algarum TaxID=2975278 RepID=A0ABU5F186_9BACT|nr:Xaa-Pro peptidase family protein [Gemmata algarum]MDY3554682.1 Xaa-Pro peptidase family protein [Gemmata algarum]MDY3559691.1 Xaa-Pro peptidase family protein [Gemmata algarum]
MNYLQQRRNALGQTLKSRDLDGFLVTAAVNVTYLTGFTGDSSYYAVLPKNSLLVSDTRFEEQVREECPDQDAVIRGHNKTTLEAAAEALNKSGAKAVGVEGSRITLGELEALRQLAPKITFVSVDGAIEAQRAVKDPGEVEKIRDAIKVAERGFKMFLATVREADTEKDMVDALEGYVRRAGAKCTAFPPIVAVGERGALPHATPTNKPLGDGAKLLVDFGADLVGYKSDITRTLRSPFGTSPSRRNKLERIGYDFEKLYAVVLAAQNAALAAIRPGVKAKDVDAAARKVFANARFDKYPDLKLADHFTHGLGHGIGLEIHEAPKIRANSEDVLESGMVVTIEPGIYIPGWGGIRIEDDVLITHDGCKLLTTLSREPATLAAG